MTNNEIAYKFNISVTTIYNIMKEFKEDGRTSSLMNALLSDVVYSRDFDYSKVRLNSYEDLFKSVKYRAGDGTIYIKSLLSVLPKKVKEDLLSIEEYDFLEGFIIQDNIDYYREGSIDYDLLKSKMPLQL